MNYVKFNEHTTSRSGEQTQPLIKSIVQPDATCNFSTGDKIGVFFYEIEETDESKNDFSAIKSFNPMGVNNFDRESDFSGPGLIKNRRAMMLPTNAGFRRCCEFFNLNWKRGARLVKPGAEVEHDDIIALVQFLSELKMGTHDEMEQSLKTCHLEKFCKVPDKNDVPIEEVHHQFGALL